MANMNRKQFLAAASATALTSIMPAIAQAAPRRRPNILLVLCDEWGGHQFGYRGDPNVHTPTIDRFASQSIDFVNAVADAPVCCVSRASLFTGQYPQTHRLYINDVPLKPKGVTMGEAFAGAGYRTGYIGKWHLHGSPDGTYSRRYSYIPPEARLGFDYWKVAECDHNYRRSHYYEGFDEKRKYWEGYDAFAQTADAERYIADNSGHENPYFLVVAFGGPHFPYQAPPEYADRWKDRDIQLRPNVPQRAVAAATAELRGFYPQCEIIDDCFARLLGAVDKSGAGDDTIVLFTSDHGEMAYSQGLSYKSVPWEESIRIPLLLRYPRSQQRAGHKDFSHISSPDIAPTLLGAANVEIPRNMEGTDCSAALTGNNIRKAPQSAFLNMLATSGNLRANGFSEYRGVRTSRYTYVRSLKGPWLLYDNQADPYQLHNLVNAPAARHIRAEMEAELSRQLRARGDSFRPGALYMEEDRVTHFLEARLPIVPIESFNGQWETTLREGDPFALATIADAQQLLGLSAARSIREGS